MFRISLRQLFILMATVAAAVVSLHHASTTCQALVGLLLLLVVFGAGIIGIFDRGPRRVFAIGFALVSLSYALLVLAGEEVSVSSGYNQTSNVELVATEGWPPRLPTTLLLRQLHKNLQRTAWIDFTTGQEVPGYDYSKYQAAQAAAGPVTIQPKDSPPPEVFMPTGHYWWALLLGYLGGHFARFIYLRRLKDLRSQMNQ
jgi:hypothetical protein